MEGQRRNWLQSIYAMTRIVTMSVGSWGSIEQTAPPRSAPKSPPRGRAEFEATAPF